MMKNITSALLIFFCALVLTACSSDNDPLHEYIESVKARPAKPVQPLPLFAPVAQFKYPEASNRRDPFKNPQARKKSDFSAPNPNRKKQPLEFFPLDALKFVGVLKQDSRIWGLIEQPGGKVTRIRVGDYLGQNYGKVLLIKENSIKLEELIKNQEKWEKQFITLDLNVNKGNAGS